LNVIKPAETTIVYCFQSNVTCLGKTVPQEFCFAEQQKTLGYLSKFCSSNCNYSISSENGKRFFLENSYWRSTITFIAKDGWKMHIKFTLLKLILLIMKFDSTITWKWKLLFWFEHYIFSIVEIVFLNKQNVAIPFFECKILFPGNRILFNCYRNWWFIYIYFSDTYYYKPGGYS